MTEAWKMTRTENSAALADPVAPLNTRWQRTLCILIRCRIQVPRGPLTVRRQPRS